MCYRVRSSSEAVKSNDGQQDVPFSQLRKWCKSVKEPTVIAIDTLKRVRPPKRGDQSDYAADYEACQGLLDLVHEFPGLSVFVAHHDRKAEAADVFDTVSGTLGLTGGVDTIALLKRSQGNVTLHIEGRDLLDTVEKAVAFDRETCRWSILGEAAEIQGTEQRRRVREALRNAEDGLQRGISGPRLIWPTTAPPADYFYVWLWTTRSRGSSMVFMARSAGRNATRLSLKKWNWVKKTVGMSE
jgi:hypothetical protein